MLAYPCWWHWEKNCHTGQRAQEGRGSPLRGAQAAGAGFLQADLKQGPPTVPSSSEGRLCRSPGEFGKEKPLLQAPGLCSLVP